MIEIIGIKIVKFLWGFLCSLCVANCMAKMTVSCPDNLHTLTNSGYEHLMDLGKVGTLASHLTPVSPLYAEMDFFTRERDHKGRMTYAYKGHLYAQICVYETTHQFLWEPGKLVKGYTYYGLRAPQ
jgi:hypothetical protein